MRKVIADARKTIEPTPAIKRSVKETADHIIELVREQAGRQNQVSEVDFGGSYAKGTWLKEEMDLDIFVKFKRSTSDDEFNEISHDVGFSALKDYSPYVRYADHPYVEAKILEMKINVVPCYVVGKGRWKSAADRSPYHTEYMQDALTKKMKCDVRLLKRFLMSAGIYGAEIARQGFSGYVSEVLIEWFGSFENVVKNMARIKENAVVGKAGKRFNTALVIIDPIDSKRNLAAAISRENIGRFVLRCRAFQMSPSPQFFTRARPKNTWNWMKNIMVIKFRVSPRSPDTMWGQIKRAAVSLTAQLGVEGFNVLRSGTHTDEKGHACIIFLLESVKIPEVRVNVGPDFFRESYSDRFIGKNIEKSGLMWINQDKRIVSVERREFNDARLCLKDIIKNNGNTRLPKGIRDDFGRGFRISIGASSLNKPIKEAVLGLISTDASFFHFN